MKHSLVTGISLHEMKGVASASDGDIVTALNNVSVVKKGGSINCDGTGEPFNNSCLHVQYTQTSGTDSGLTNDVNIANQVLPINTTVKNTISSAVVSSDSISLPAGNYLIRMWVGSIEAPFSGNAFIRVVGASSRLVKGVNEPIGGTSSSSTNSASATCVGKFTLDNTSDVELLISFLSGGINPTSNIIGKAVSSGETEVYHNTVIWKLS